MDQTVYEPKNSCKKPKFKIRHSQIRTPSLFEGYSTNKEMLSDFKEAHQVQEKTRSGQKLFEINQKLY